MDEYLRGGGAGWIVELRKVLEELDWGLLTLGLSPDRSQGGPSPGPHVGVIDPYGILSRRWSLRELEVGRRAARRGVVGVWGASAGSQYDWGVH